MSKICFVYTFRLHLDEIRIAAGPTTQYYLGSGHKVWGRVGRRGFSKITQIFHNPLNIQEKFHNPLKIYIFLS